MPQKWGSFSTQGTDTRVDGVLLVTSNSFHRQVKFSTSCFQNPRVSKAEAAASASHSREGACQSVQSPALHRVTQVQLEVMPGHRAKSKSWAAPDYDPKMKDHVTWRIEAKYICPLASLFMLSFELKSSEKPWGTECHTEQSSQVMGLWKLLTISKEIECLE